MFMQAIHAEIEQSVENEVARLTVERMLNHDSEFVLSTTGGVGNEKTYETMNEKPELDVNSGEEAAYFNNYESVGEDLEFGKNTARFEVSDVAAYIDLFDEKLVVKEPALLIKCFEFQFCRYKRVC